MNNDRSVLMDILREELMAMTKAANDKSLPAVQQERNKKRLHCFVRELDKAFAFYGNMLEGDYEADPMDRVTYWNGKDGKPVLKYVRNNDDIFNLINSLERQESMLQLFYNIGYADQRCNDEELPAEQREKWHEFRNRHVDILGTYGDYVSYEQVGALSRLFLELAPAMQVGSEDGIDPLE